MKKFDAILSVVVALLLGIFIGAFVQDTFFPTVINNYYHHDPPKVRFV